MDWPADLPRPSPAALYEWLNRAYEEKLLRRMGSGRRSDPYQFRLTNEDDEYLDRGEIPPLRRGPLMSVAEIEAILNIDEAKRQKGKPPRGAGGS